MGTQLLACRLKSARRKKRLQKENRDKQLLALDRERRRIRKDPDYITTIPLDEPYQKGWKRLFVLKPEVQRSDKAQFYQGILDKINTVQYHYDKSFKNSKRVKHWHRYYHTGPPTLRPLHRIQYYRDKRKLTDEELSYFIKVKYWNENDRAWAYRYEFTEPWRFKIVVKPHIIYEVKQVDTIMQQRLAWIDGHMDNDYLQCRLQKLHKGGYNNRWKKSFERLKYRNPLKNKADWDWDEK